MTEIDNSLMIENNDEQWRHVISNQISLATSMVLYCSWYTMIIVAHRIETSWRGEAKFVAQAPERYIDQCTAITPFKRGSCTDFWKCFIERIERS